MPMPAQILAFTVSETEHGLRLDRALAGLAGSHGLSREQVKRHILGDQVRCNGAVCRNPRQSVRNGDSLELTLDIQGPEVTPERGGVDIVYEDAHLLVINKPAGLTVHPCPSCPQGTLLHRLLHHYPDMEGSGLRPGIVHRLDKDTSGLLIVARTEKDRLKLSESFAGRQVDKAYLALVHGVPQPGSGEINAPMGRHPTRKTCMAVQAGGREAVSRYRTVYADPDGRFALLEVQILTGRTHQIRVHLAHLGHPLWGDSTYGGKKRLPAYQPGGSPAQGRLVAERQMLHARYLSFAHPETGNRLAFNKDWPDDFESALRVLLWQPVHVVITGVPGCGKSALLHDLEDLGLPVFSADAAVRRLYEPGGAGWDLLDRRFSGQFTPDPSLAVDRKILAAAMREDDALRLEVEHLIHPLVREEIGDFFKAETLGTGRVAEIPLYFESGWQARQYTALPENVAPPLPADHHLSFGGRGLPGNPAEPIVVVVTCPEDQRFARLAGRGVSGDTARMLTAWQWPEAEKSKHAHILVDNGGSRKDLNEAAHDLAAYLESLAEAHVGRLIAKCREALSGADCEL